MAYFISQPPVKGNPGDIDTVARNVIGTRATDAEGRIYVYLKGVANTLVGSWVTFDEDGITALLAADAKGPVAVASAAIVADRWGWYCIYGKVMAQIAANSADNARLGRETANGVAGDGRAAGDEIIGAISRSATTDAALALVQIYHPLVNDITGA